eukprot:scaffold123454_cov32-Tisochrysis_lutea.AAC.1
METYETSTPNRTRTPRSAPAASSASSTCSDDLPPSSSSIPRGAVRAGGVAAGHSRTPAAAHERSREHMRGGAARAVLLACKAATPLTRTSTCTSASRRSRPVHNIEPPWAPTTPPFSLALSPARSALLLPPVSLSPLPL